MVELLIQKKLVELCRKYNLKLVEDCAQSHGCLYQDGRMTGNIGDAARSLILSRQESLEHLVMVVLLLPITQN